MQVALGVRGVTFLLTNLTPSVGLFCWLRLKWKTKSKPNLHRSENLAVVFLLNRCCDNAQMDVYNSSEWFSQTNCSGPSGSHLIWKDHETVPATTWLTYNQSESQKHFDGLCGCQYNSWWAVVRLTITHYGSGYSSSVWFSLHIFAWCLIGALTRQPIEVLSPYRSIGGCQTSPHPKWNARLQ